MFRKGQVLTIKLSQIFKSIFCLKRRPSRLTEHPHMLYLFQRKNYKDFNNPIYSLIGNVLALVFGHFPFAHFFLPRKLGVSTSKLPKQIIWVEQVFHALSFEYRVWGVLGSSRRVLFKATFLWNNDLSHPYQHFYRIRFPWPGEPKEICASFLLTCVSSAWFL